jgi:multicomponent Na+:H+ antiporter subunit D
VLQASAVAITGAFGLIKVMIFVFGPGLGQAGQTGLVLAAFALAGAFVVALVALSRPLLADRFAYTSVAHLGMIAAAALIATPAAWLAAALLLAGHACAKLAMILAAGSVELATGRTEVGELEGLGRRMPWTFLAFSAGALSLAALPPFAGAWGALWLVAGAAEIGAIWAAAAVIAISALIFAALAAPAARAIFGQPPAHPFTRPDGVSALLVATAAVVGLASAALTMALDPIQRFLMLGPGAGGGG